MAAATWLSRVREQVDARLAEFFRAAREEAAGLSSAGPELVDSLSDLTLRGGKRFRPALLFAGYTAVSEERSTEEVIEAAAALELFQSYLLIHDDWMDGDETRRGGPAVHAALAKQHGDPKLGASLAILTGNLASAQAWQLLLDGPWPSERKARAVQVFHRMHREVVLGQHLDLLASDEVERMQQLKTGSYTVRAPLELAWVLADGSEPQREALLAYGRPLGQAFQMRDDLLGAFGDPERTGKPSGGDLRRGRRTSLVRAASELASEAQREVLRSVLEGAEPGDADIEAARTVLVECGARDAVEARLEAFGTEAVGALRGAPLSPGGRSMLQQLAERLTLRDR